MFSRYPMTNNLRHFILKLVYNCITRPATPWFIEKFFRSKCQLYREPTVFFLWVQTMATNSLRVKTVGKENLVRGGLVLVNEHQLHLHIVMLQTISSWFRRINVLIQRTEPKRLASCRHRWLQFSNNMGRGSSRAQVIWISNIRFLEFSLLFHLSFLVHVFNNWNYAQKSRMRYGARLKFTWESNRLQMTKKLRNFSYNDSKHCRESRQRWIRTLLIDKLSIKLKLVRALLFTDYIKS